jgi:hypothetical protein
MERDSTSVAGELTADGSGEHLAPGRQVLLCLREGRLSVGWLAATLLVAGVGSRMVFA